jgi:hypothetical protein
MGPIRTRDDAGVVLTYEDFYGEMPTLDALIAILTKFSADDWLCQLARLSVLLGGENSRRPQWANAFLVNFTPPDKVGEINAWFAKHQSQGITATVPSERDIGILIELAILHAPPSAARRMEFPADSKVVFDALLMVTSLSQPRLDGVSASKEIASICATMWVRSLCPDPVALASHGYHLFEVLKSQRSAKAAEWASIFKMATGQTIDDYFAGGVSIIAQLLSQSPQDIGSCWTSIYDPKHLVKTSSIKKPLEAYCCLRASSLMELKRSIDEEETNKTDIGAYNLIALKRSPLVEYADTIYPLYLHGIATSVLDGVYHAVIPSAEDDNSVNARKRIGGIFGTLYEQDILNILTLGFGDRVLRNPVRTDNAKEAADAVLLCDQGLIVFQIKGCHVPVQTRFLLRTPSTLQELFQRVGLTRATEQLAQTTEACRQGVVQGIPEYWSRADTFIQPIIVTYERVPEISLVRAEIEALTSTACDRQTRKPILVCSDDVERLTSLPPGETLWGLTTEYISDQGYRSRCFHNFLNRKGVKGGELFVERRRAMLRTVAQHLGFDPAALQEELPKNGDLGDSA